MQPPADNFEIEQLVCQQVVLDLSSPLVYVGRLVAQALSYLVQADVNVHAAARHLRPRARNTSSLGRQHSIHPNRPQTWVSLYQIVGISRLDDRIAN